MIVFLIFSIILCLICFILSIVVEDKEGSNLFSFLSGGTLILCVLLIIYIEEKNNIPTALDVYQGETTLKYEVIDGVKVDSVVVFKDEFKK